MTATQNFFHIKLALVIVVLAGCAAPPRVTEPNDPVNHASITPGRPHAVRLASHQESSDSDEFDEANENVIGESLTDLEVQASRSNPLVQQLAQEYQAARAKARYVDKLPDPTIGANIFGHPIETAAGSQRANLTVSQMLPWLARLDAQAQEACFQAMALGRMHAAERLRVVGDIRALWYRLYVIEKQIEINTANQELLKSLIDVANSRVSTGNASQGDVLIGTLEYSKLEETLVGLRQQRASVMAEINRIAGRDASVPIVPPSELEVVLPDWDHSMLRELAWQNQPEIEMARIRTQASRWGVEVARLKRRPEFTVNASWFAIDDNRPASSIVSVGEDAWAIGAMMSLPVRHDKYDAIEQEARWKHAASHSSVEQLIQKYDALLLDLIEQARAADETARLYESTIIPDAKRTLNADQESYTNGEVEFDRIVQDFRNLLTLELGLHRSLGQLTTTVARIQQAVATELISTSTPPRDFSYGPDETLDAESVPPPHPAVGSDFERD